MFNPDSPDTNEDRPSTVDRRAFLTRTAVAAGLSVAAPFQALVDRSASSGVRAQGLGYGPLQPTNDETTGLPLLLLPAGFRYISFGWTGDLLEDGTPTPGAHDGMAAYRMTRNFVRLIRNHELGPGQNTFAPHVTYDPGAGGGTTTIDFDTRRGQVVRAFSSLSGTVRNCAGGPDALGLVADVRRGARRAHGQQRSDAAARLHLRRARHGAAGDGGAARGDGPLHARGRRGRSGHGHRLRDRRRGQQLRLLSLPPQSGRQPRGRRQAADARHRRPSAVQHAHGTRRWARRIRRSGTTSPIRIARISRVRRTGRACTAQGFEQGGASFGRLEGAWYGNGHIYFVSTSGGNAGRGQIWSYDTGGEHAEADLRIAGRGGAQRAGQHLRDAARRPRAVRRRRRQRPVHARPDRQRRDLPALPQQRAARRPAQRHLGDFRAASSRARATARTASWLFFNIQTPGITFALTGPWENGAL